VFNSYPGAGAARAGASMPNYFDRRGNIAAFDAISIYQRGRAVVGDSGSPTYVARDRVSPEFFDMLGVPLLMGRTFTEDEMLYDNWLRVIVTYEFWQSYYQGDPEVLGRTLTVDSQVAEVVGVLPPGFRFLDSQAKFIMPLASNLRDREPDRRHSNNQQMIARLAPGATLADAQAQMDAFNAVQIDNDPYAQILRDADYHTEVHALHADTVRNVRSILLLLQGGVFALLLIGAVNLVNLLLIRAHGRAKEFAVRQALGASRRDLAREILADTVVITLGGGLLGLATGALGIRLLTALGTDQMPLGVAITFDSRVALISLAASALLGVVLALPLLFVSLRTQLAPVLQAETRGGTISRAAQRVRHGFIIAQVALAFVLLSGAGLLGMSLRKVLGTDPGFQATQVLTGAINTPWETYRESEDYQGFYRRLIAELQRQPGVNHAGLVSGLPFGGNHSDNATTVEGVEPAPGESIRTHFTTAILGDYFPALGIPLREGRFFSAADEVSEERICIVDEDFVRRYWPNGESPIGRRIASDVEVTDENAMTIVGVVGGIKTEDLVDDRRLGTVYLPYRQAEYRNMYAVLQTGMDPVAITGTLRRVVLDLDPQLPVDDIQVLQHRIDESLTARRSPAILAGIFAGVALLLAAVGTYGVLAYAVGQRRREIGVRMALGALPGQVLAQFLGLGTKLLAVGVVLGVFGAWGTGVAMQSVLYEVAPFHAGIIAATATVLALVVLCASLLPSHRASRVSPMEALRDD